MHGLILTESHHGWISGNGAMENTLADMMPRKRATILPHDSDVRRRIRLRGPCSTRWGLRGFAALSGPSSNGRTADFGSVNGGSNPPGPIALRSARSSADRSNLGLRGDTSSTQKLGESPLA